MSEQTNIWVSADGGRHWQPAPQWLEPAEMAWLAAQRRMAERRRRFAVAAAVVLAVWWWRR